MDKPHKRTNSTPVSSGGDYGGSARKTIASATSDSLGSVGKATSKPGNPGGGMGVGKGKARAFSQSGDRGGIAAGHSRTARGKNDTASGPQGMRG